MMADGFRRPDGLRCEGNVYFLRLRFVKISQDAQQYSANDLLPLDRKLCNKNGCKLHINTIKIIIKKLNLTYSFCPSSDTFTYIYFQVLFLCGILSSRPNIWTALFSRSTPGLVF